MGNQKSQNLNFVRRDAAFSPYLGTCFIQGKKVKTSEDDQISLEITN